MNKLFKIEREDYYISEDKKTVTCVLTIERKNNYSKLPDSIGVRSEQMGLDNIFYAQIGVNRYRVVGKAKCAPEDEFDEKKGLIIARCRAYVKFNKLVTNYVNTIVKQIERDAYTLGDILKQCKHDISVDTRTLNKTLNDGTEH